jgi:tRNA (cmo5U34)-methyltransferase
MQEEQNQTQEQDTPQWSEENSQLFIDYGRYFVPEREMQIDIVCGLIPVVAGEQHVLDLCCGEGLLTQAILERFPAYHVHAFDGSDVMLARVQQRCSSYSQRLHTQRFQLEDTSWRNVSYPVRAVVSSLSVHHLDDAQKWQLFRDIRRMLAPGGVFMLADILQPVTPLGVQVAAKMWDDEVRRRAMELDGHLEGYQHFLDEQWNSFTLPEPDPFDKMSPLFTQLKWLEEVGFTDIDVYWMKAGQAIFGGQKR